MKISDLQALFWDFDGVIADSTEVKSRAFEEMFAPYGETVKEQALQHHQQHGGISRVEKIDYSFRHFVGQPLSQTELNAKCELFSSLVKQKVIAAPLISGVADALESLYPDVPMFIISGTPEDELLEIVRARDLSRYFKRVLGSPVKKPDHVRSLLAEFNFEPAGCVFIGDALTDLDAATVNGTRFIGIRGFNTFPDSALVLPDCTGLLDALQAI